MLLLGLSLAPLALANMDSGGVHSPMHGPPGRRIAIRVVNSPVVPVKSLAQAEKIAGQILANAAVEVIWVDCDTAALGQTDNPCAQDRGPTDFWLHMLKRNPQNFYGDVTGFAMLTPLWKDGECYAGVSYPMVEAAAKSLDVEVSHILGATLAHEIGHLLLGAHSHFPTGVMCPRFGRQQLRMVARGELLFTPEQAARIRAEVARRVAR
jgi:hypothetical protein